MAGKVLPCSAGPDISVQKWMGSRRKPAAYALPDLAASVHQRSGCHVTVDLHDHMGIATLQTGRGRKCVAITRVALCRAVSSS